MCIALFGRFARRGLKFGRFLPLIFLVNFAWAKVVDFKVWQVNPNGPKILIPVIEGENIEVTTQKYLEKLKASPFYSQLPGSKELKIGNDHPYFGTFDSYDKKGNVPIVATTNLITQMLGSPYIQQTIKSFARHRADIYLVPVGLETHFSPEELSEFHTLISDRAPALLALGGADIAPSLYGQPNTHSIGTHPERDLTEVSLIRKYTARGKGVFYAICRGHQLSCVEMGGELFQEVSEQVPTKTEHRTDLTALFGGNSADADHSFDEAMCHSITLTDSFNAIYEAVRETTFTVNSLHHQAVKSIPEGSGKIIAYEQDGGENVVEAVEVRSPDGKVRRLTFQFHPELMKDNPQAEKILHWIVENVNHVYE